MKKTMINTIRGIPIHSPYMDYDRLRMIPGFDNRIVLCDEEITDEQADIINQRIDQDFAEHPEKYKDTDIESLKVDSNHIPVLAAARFIAGRKMAEIMTAKGLEKVYLASATGLDLSALSRMTSGERPFSTAADIVYDICYNYLGLSCHTMLFGEDVDFHLPSLYSTITERLHSISVTQLVNLIEIGEAMCAKQKFNYSVMIQERFFEYFYESGKRAINFAGDRTPRKLYERIRSILETEYSDEPESIPRNSTMMTISFETGWPLDFFIAPDWLRYAKVIYKKKGQEIELKNPQILKILNICYKLQGSIKEEYVNNVAEVAFGQFVTAKSGRR